LLVTSIGDGCRHFDALRPSDARRTAGGEIRIALALAATPLIPLAVVE
jgi:hypothetical protein